MSNDRGDVSAPAASVLPTDAMLRTKAMRSALLSGFGSKIATTVLGFVSIGLAVRTLGAGPYGVVATLTGLAGALGFFDFGIGNATISEAAKAFASNDHSGLRRLVNSTVAFLGTVSFTAGSLLLGAISVAPDEVLFSAPSVDAVQIRLSLMVFVASASLSIVLSIGVRLCLAIQKGWVAGYTNFASALIVVALCACGSFSHLPLLYFVIVFVFTPIIANGVVSFVVVRKLCQPGGWRPRFSRREFGISLRAGFPFMLLGGAMAATEQGQYLVVMYAVGSSDAAVFGVVTRLFVGVMALFTSGLLQLWASTSHALAQGDAKWVRRAFFRVFIGSMSFYVFAAICLVLFGGSFISLWAGPAFVPAVSVLIAIGIWSAYSFALSQVSMLLNGADRVRIQAILYLAYALASIPLSLLWGKEFGLAGVAYANLVTHVILVGIPYAFMAGRVLRSGRSLASSVLQ